MTLFLNSKDFSWFPCRRGAAWHKCHPPLHPWWYSLKSKVSICTSWLQRSCTDFTCIFVPWMSHDMLHFFTLCSSAYTPLWCYLPHALQPNAINKTGFPLTAGKSAQHLWMWRWKLLETVGSYCMLLNAALNTSVSGNRVGGMNVSRKWKYS